jgi:hypothetical protein
MFFFIEFFDHGAINLPTGRLIVKLSRNGIIIVVQGLGKFFTVLSGGSTLNQLPQNPLFRPPSPPATFFTHPPSNKHDAAKGFVSPKEGTMKKLFAVAMALFFMTATSGLVLAQGSTSPAPAKTTAKSTKSTKKGHKGGKKGKKGAVSTTAPSTSTAPATK